MAPMDVIWLFLVKMYGDHVPFASQFVNLHLPPTLPSYRDASDDGYTSNKLIF